ncbi:glycerophosphodiester phosphodiesterase [Psychroserpens sp.]|uniref:glycerophosphodiester phosphodiesterase n=1 Tax=Psychroserpens sp. TaxID=2020870 RepID=UPI001B09E377|nr:glycerophosphodiester phosphodiesterase family protein [Psychroserpens sp.]MBO6605755.1 glycerophosphodiester phosphodiesterase [Psychroserpens sp.]MBO6630125.1 glycerophosphodiester phosphodiesterase [Psychroserpens sp.]MBO6652874.1 glycerophosphodiester phosphodiesterase [Psychroserpens sp.]MBO6681354.1 glycerophosphodiester phosphodiesterase [Psychroserpens sp.]MBO6749129.1 glycerophosphodiester phosphodiesterase [Psychroserpens sp.]
MKTPLKIGHRGAKAYASENTIASVIKALNLGVDGIEIDVHKSATGEIVVFHDFTLDRMTDGSGEIHKLSWDQLRTVKVNGGHKIPKLEDVLDVIDKKCIVNIELKGKDTAEGAFEIINHYIKAKNWTPDHFLVSSFQISELKRMSQLIPHVELAVLSKASVDSAIEIAKTINARTIHPNYALLSKSNVQEAQQRGFKVNTWTVNDIDSIARIKSYGVNGIISDNPDYI